MILRFLTRTTKILENCDDARTAFLQETKNLQNYIDEETSKKCFNSFIAGMLTTVLFSSTIIYFMSSDYRIFVSQLFKGVV